MSKTPFWNVFFLNGIVNAEWCQTADTLRQCLQAATLPHDVINIYCENMRKVLGLKDEMQVIRTLFQFIICRPCGHF